MSPTPRARRGLLWTVGAIAAALVLGRVAAALYVDHAWYASVGALAVWHEQLVDELILRGSLFVIGSALVFANVYAVRSSVVSLVLPRRVANLEIGEQVGPRTLTAAAIALSLALGALLAAAYDGWTSVALARAAVPFGEREPYLDVDLRFYVAWLPLESGLYVWTLLAVALATAVTVFLYALTPSLRWERGGLRVSAYVRRHFVSLGALFCVILAWSYRLDSYGALVSDGTTSFGWVDHRVTIPASVVLSIAAMATAATLLVAGWRGRLRIAFIAVSIMLGLAVTARQLAPFVARQMLGASETRTEASYEATRIAYTRRAFGANDVTVGDSSLLLDSAASAISRTSVWDAPFLVRAVTRGRTVRVAGGPVPTVPSGTLLLAAGPADDTEAATGDGWTAVRRAAVATDGRGAPLSVDAAGGGATEDQTLAAVRVWNAQLPTLRIAAGDAASSGVLSAPMSGWLQRLAYAWSEQDFTLLRADASGVQRVMLRRALGERLGAIVPFFRQGVASPAVLADSLFWIVPLYVASAYYPLSDAISVAPSRLTYVRHAATALVNASTGRVTVVGDSSPDKLTQAWMDRFPTLFARWSQLPEPLRRQVPPATDAALAQGFAYARYGSRTAPSTGRRVVDPDAAGTSGAEGHDLIDVGEGQSAWPLPVVTIGDEVAGVIVGVGGPQPHTAYLAASGPRVRWSTLPERLNRADDRESRDGADSTVAGARMLLGRVRAVPLRNGSLAFVRTAYRVRPDGAPLVAHVAIATADSAWSVRSFAAEPAIASPGSTPTLGPTIAPAALYDSSRSALRRGDWAGFGAAFDALGRALGRPSARTPR